MSRRPGFVLEVDKSTPPTLFWNGEGFTLETLPEGSRVIYAPEPMKAIDDPYDAIRHALLHPVGDRDPLPALLRSGMKLTICFDDISLPLPQMEAPDVRQMVIETVLDMAADAGVDDVVLVAALALHRRMTEAELRHALGDRVYDAFAPHGLLTQHDAEDPDNLDPPGPDRPGRGRRDQQAGRHLGPPRLREHQPRLHGRRAQERGHRAGQLPQPAPPPQPAHHAALQVVHGPAVVRAALVELAHGPAHRRVGGEGVPDRDDAQQRHVPVELPVPAEARVGMDAARPGHLRHDVGRPVQGPARLAARSSTPSGRRTR